VGFRIQLTPVLCSWVGCDRLSCIGVSGLWRLEVFGLWVVAILEGSYTSQGKAEGSLHWKLGL
jgi:hypothetical protein